MTDDTALVTWRALREHAELELTRASIASPAAEARWIVAEVSGYVPTELATHERDEAAPAVAVTRIGQLLARRIAGEPLQYVLGAWSFRGIDLMVDRRVLIPRPETEMTAEIAIDEAVRLGARRGRRDPWSGSTTSYSVADLGTGSGVLALALASELPDADVWATDVSDDAIAVARANLASVPSSAAARVRLVHGDWFAALPDELRGRLRVVATNPPYVAEHEVADLPPEVAASRTDRRIGQRSDRCRSDHPHHRRRAGVARSGRDARVRACSTPSRSRNPCRARSRLHRGARAPRPDRSSARVLVARRTP